MPVSDKRARKKEFRDQALAERTAALKRRRAARLGGILGVVAVIVGAALFSGRDDGSGNGTEPGNGPSGNAAACEGEPPPEANPQQYDAPPEAALAEGTDYGAVIQTSCGPIEVDLLEEEAPVSVNNFVFLAREGFYDGLAWHRIVRNFVVQAGDPVPPPNELPNGPGYTIEDELPGQANDYVYGTMAMANTGQPNTSSSQFFIVVHQGANEDKTAPAGLQKLYSIFGVVAESSYATLEALEVLPVDPATDEPEVPAYIESIEITET